MLDQVRNIYLEAIRNFKRRVLSEEALQNCKNNSFYWGEYTPSENEILDSFPIVQVLIVNNPGDYDTTIFKTINLHHNEWCEVSPELVCKHLIHPLNPLAGIVTATGAVAMSPEGVHASHIFINKCVSDGVCSEDHANQIRTWYALFEGFTGITLHGSVINDIIAAYGGCSKEGVKLIESFILAHERVHLTQHDLKLTSKTDANCYGVMLASNNNQFHELEADYIALLELGLIN